MSFILDALNKAENERHLGNVPTIESQQVAFTEEKKPRTLTIVIAAALMLNFALLAYVFIGKTGAEESGQLTQINPVQPDKIIGLKSDVKQPAVNSVDVRLVNAGANKTNLNQQASKKITLSPLDDVNKQMAEILKQDNSGDSMRITSDSTTDSSGMVATQGNDSLSSQPTVKSFVQKIAVVEDLPLLTQKSAEFQQQIPDLTIDVHVYSATPGKRFILINLQKYQEDDVIAKGLMLEQITEEGLVLSYQDERFRWPMLTR